MNRNSTIFRELNGVQNSLKLIQHDNLSSNITVSNDHKAVPDAFYLKGSLFPVFTLRKCERQNFRNSEQFMLTKIISR